MKKLLAFVLCAALAAALCAPAAAYADVDEAAWYAPAVEYCREHNLLNGVGGDAFDPQGAVTRAQLATALWRMAGQPAVAAHSGFTDVATGAWYDLAVRWAKRAGVTAGVGGRAFDPDGALTREQLVTFLYRYAGLPAAAWADFADQSAISDWAQTAARWAAGAGVMQGKGDGAFDPAGGATRAELAQVLMNYAEKVGNAPAVREEMNATCIPMGIALSSDGSMLVTDAGNQAIWRVVGLGSERIAGAVSGEDAGGRALGGYLDGPVNQCLFNGPWGIAPFLGGWAISEPENNTVRLLYNGTVSTLTGIAFSMPTGLAADAEGNLFVSNTAAGTVVRVSPKGESAVVAEGLNGPTALAWGDGVLYIAETDADRILRLPDGGKAEVFAGGAEGYLDGPAAEAAFCGPQGLALGPDGALYVSDTANSAIRCIRNGAVTTLLDHMGEQWKETWPAAPMGLVLEGNVLTICDSFSGKLFTVNAG